jgi:hypothetical protein
MAVIVAVMGESGTGKSTSLRNFQKGEASVINVSKKPLPFRNTLSVFKTDNYQEVQAMIKRAQAKSVVIDDAQYLMAFEYMHRAKEKGFEKFTDIGANFFNLTQTAVALPDDKIVYFLFHIERTKDGNEKCKTIGQLLDEKITLEGLFTIVLKTVVLLDGNNQRQFCFATVNNGSDTVKTPMGMFTEPLIPNDLKAVDTVIREYYGMPENVFTLPHSNTMQQETKQGNAQNSDMPPQNPCNQQSSILNFAKSYTEIV